MIIEKKKISDLKPAPYNPRKSNEKQEANLKKSLEKFGVVEPIVFNKQTGCIVGGHFRVRELKKLGYKEVECVIVDLNEADEKELNIRLNANTGEWNFDELANNWEAEKLTEWGMDISTEWGKENIDENEDEIPETKEAFIKKGDLIEMNNHRLLCGDSCNDADINILMNGKQADMIFIDPPFDLEDNYSKITIAKAKKDAHVFIMNSDKLLIQNIKNNETYFRKMFYVDFKLARLVSNNQPMTRIDPIAEFCKGKTKFNNLKDAFSTLIECAQIHINNNQNYGFKQAKKVELPETFILHYSNPNELVCDFFGGAGSTLIACEKNNRICYMNEFEPLHCDIILKRWILYMKEHNKLFEVKINGEKIDVNMLETI